MSAKEKAPFLQIGTRKHSAPSHEACNTPHDGDTTSPAGQTRLAIGKGLRGGVQMRDFEIMVGENALGLGGGQDATYAYRNLTSAGLSGGDLTAFRFHGRSHLIQYSYRAIELQT